MGESTQLSSQRGAGKIKALVVLFILGAIVYVGFQVAPHYFASYQLKDAMDVEARFASVQRKPPDQIKEAIFKKMEDLEIQATRDSITVESNDRAVKIRVKYQVVVDLPGYQLKLNFNPEADNRRL